jgi:hypothetical protein
MMNLYLVTALETFYPDSFGFKILVIGILSVIVDRISFWPNLIGFYCLQIHRKIDLLNATFY